MKKYALEIRWGLIFAGVSLAWILFEKVMGWHDSAIDQHASYTMLFIPVAFCVYYLAFRQKKKQQGDLTLLQALITGTLIGIVVMLLTPLTQYLTHNVISPNFFENAITHAVSTGNMSQDEAEEYFSLPNYIIQAGLSAVPLGVVTSLIVGGVMVLLQKKGHN